MAQNVLFLCRTNSARSIIAEAVLNHLGGGRFRGHSAGNDPSGRVHPLAIEQLNRDGCETAGLRSKSWTEFSTRGAPRIDYVITLCDVMAFEACPIFPGRPVHAHWSITDPALVAGSIDEQRRAFHDALEAIGRRVQRFTGLPFESLDRHVLKGLVTGVGIEQTA
jgi:arsenate reductase (thioredoxin)